MPVPPSLLDISAALGDAYRRAEEELNGRLAEILHDPNRGSEQRRLKALLRDIETRQRDLGGEARRWIETNLPTAYSAGGESNSSSFTWTQAHRNAVGQLANDTYADVLKTTRRMSRDVKALIRVLGQERATTKVITGQTALSAAKDLERSLLSRGISAITYRDGRNIRASTYAEMLMRTKTAAAYNLGNLNEVAGAGVTVVEGIDNPDCGLTAHDDGQKVNGVTFAIEIASAYLIGHPNCVRDWAPRPDLSAGDVGRDDVSLQEDYARADQAAFVQYLRDNQIPARRASSTRFDRQPRQARKSRTARSRS